MSLVVQRVGSGYVMRPPDTGHRRRLAGIGHGRERTGGPASVGRVTNGDDAAGSPVLPFRQDVEVVLLLTSRRHRYEGRPADGPLPADEDERRDRIELRAGLGIVGDRYFASRAHVHASVTLIGLEGLDAVGRELGVTVDR